MKISIILKSMAEIRKWHNSVALKHCKLRDLINHYNAIT